MFVGPGPKYAKATSTADTKVVAFKKLVFTISRFHQEIKVAQQL